MRPARRRPVALLACLTLLGGCSGWPSPASDSGLPESQSGGYCSDTGRISEEIKAPAGVRVVVRPGKDKLNRTILLNVALLLPPGVSVKLARTEVVLRSPAWPVPRPLAVHHISARGGRHYPPTTLLTGTAVRPDNVYTLWYSAERQTIDPETGIPQADAFAVVLPPLEIEGEAWQAQPISFTSYRSRGMFSCGV